MSEQSIRNKALRAANNLQEDKRISPEEWDMVKNAVEDALEEEPRTLKGYLSLSDWTTLDLACYYLAISLGVLAPNADYEDERWLVWTNNDLAIEMYELLFGMISANILLPHPEEGTSKVRWNDNFELESLLVQRDG